MRISQEIVTVWADSAAGEVNVVLAGLRIALTTDETTLLAERLAASLEQLREDAAEAGGTGRPGARISEARPALMDKGEAGRPFVSPAVPEAEAKQLRTRALIQATIRDKGLAVREDQKV